MASLSRAALALVSLVSGILVGTSACSTDVDGAPNPDGKDPGATCSDDVECKSLGCKGGTCTAVVPGGNPKDGMKDGDESDVDCGGTVAPPCTDGKGCTEGGDCASGSCTGGTCKAPAPDDKIKNGDETDVDCGGSKAPKCDVAKGCANDEDCTSGACSYAQKCVESPSCTGHFGGDTCGEGETGTADAKHESCCATVTNSKGLRIGKYHITAGRMRAFIERYNGNLQQWAATNPPAWDGNLTDELPASMDDALYMLGPYTKRGCSITSEGRGARTYWQDPIDDDKNDLPKDVLDEKALNCVPWVLATALCAFDGGRLPTQAEAMAIAENDGENDWPWQFQDPAPHVDKSEGQYEDDARFVHWRNYVTPNAPANMRQDGDGPLDRSFYIAPPGRKPTAANKIGVQDAVGNLLTWLSDGRNRVAWTASWEEHEKQNKVLTWPSNKNEDEAMGYYAIGARCVFE
jgi:hypothetical protein